MGPVLLALLLAVGAVQAAPACPALQGRYRMTDAAAASTENARAPRLEVLRALRLADGPGGARDLEIDADPGGRSMTVRLIAVPGGSGRSPPQPQATLALGTDYDCIDGWAVMRSPVPAARRMEAAYLEGATRVALRSGSGGSLAFELRFSGVERSTIYSYDSARLSLPRPLSRRTRLDTLVWLPAHEAAPPPLPPRPPDPAQPAAERSETALRGRLNALMVGTTVGAVTPEATGLRVGLRATRAEHVVATEDRLLASDLAYEVLREPSWSNNAWESEILVRTAHGPGGARPSAFRVAAELDRLMCRGSSRFAHVVTAAREGDGYQVQVALVGGLTGVEAQACVAQRSGLVRELRLVGTVRDVSGGARVLEVWRVTLRS